MTIAVDLGRKATKQNIPKVKFVKIWVLLENIVHIERPSVFVIKVLCNYTFDNEVFICFRSL